MSQKTENAANDTPNESESANSEVIENLNADLAPLKEVGPNASVNLDDLDQYQRDSLHAEEAYARAVEESTHGDLEKAVQGFLRAAKIAETVREWLVAAVALERVGDFLQDPKPPANLERAFRIYHRAIAAYENCGYLEEARRLLYRMQFLKMTRAAELRISTARRLEMLLFWLATGFGYRPLRVVCTATVFVFVYGLLYWATGSVMSASSRDHAGFWEAIYFSGATFTTIGYGDFVRRRAFGCWFSLKGRSACCPWAFSW